MSLSIQLGVAVAESLSFGEHLPPRAGKGRRGHWIQGSATGGSFAPDLNWTDLTPNRGGIIDPNGYPKPALSHRIPRAIAESEFGLA